MVTGIHAIAAMKYLADRNAPTRRRHCTPQPRVIPPPSIKQHGPEEIRLDQGIDRAFSLLTLRVRFVRRAMCVHFFRSDRFFVSSNSIKKRDVPRECIILLDFVALPGAYDSWPI